MQHVKKICFSPITLNLSGPEDEADLPPTSSTSNGCGNQIPLVPADASCKQLLSTDSAQINLSIF